jgi:signal transduction histidine kinase
MISTNAQFRGASPKNAGDKESSDDEIFAGRAVAVLTQELANPLNDMHTLTRLMEHYLRKKMGGDKFLSVTVQNLTIEISRLKALVEEFRVLVRRQEVTLCAVNLAEAVREYLLAHESDYNTKGIRVEKIFPQPLPPASADRGRLRDILHNLCANAVEAMPEGGVLTLRGWSDARHVHLDVQDTGTGIPQGLNIFEPFVTTKRNGTGLGLAIVRQITAAHGGSVTYSSNPGTGATFTLSLPLARGAPKG